MSSTVRARAVSERIARFRRRRGMTQRALAGASGLPYGAISGYERGGAIPPERLALVATALDVSVADLIRDAQPLDLSWDEVAMVQALRALPAKGRAYIHGLMVDAAAGRIAR